MLLSATLGRKWSLPLAIKLKKHSLSSTRKTCTTNEPENADVSCTSSREEM
jgi:hypothetical protein